MFDFDLSGLAVFLVLLGLFFFLAVYFLLKLLPRFNRNIQREDTPGGQNLVSEHDEAVLVVHAGGRIRSINPKAQQMFRLQEGESPNIERLAKKARPSDSLLQLFAFEGKARFLLDGRLVEGSSFVVSSGQERFVVVTLHYSEISGGLAGAESGLSAQALHTFTELTQAMAASLDLEKTLQAVLENIEKIIPADFLEVALWDEESEILVPYRLAGEAGVDRKLCPAADRYKPGFGFNALVFQQRQPVVIQDIEDYPELQSAVRMSGLPLVSFLGIPLMAGSEAIGALGWGSMVPKLFGEADLELAKILSSQAAIAIHNALLFGAEQKRTAELSGLAQLAQAFSSVRNPEAVFSRLVTSIVPLVPVEILGFLIYNDSHRVLEAQTPFHGLPDQIVRLYHTHVAAGSAAEGILLDQDMLISDNAAVDQKWVQLGLEHISQAASLRETALVPLLASGHMLGYLQASNHTDGSTAFSQPELHLLMIAANQAASIIENTTLIQQSRQRVLRAETLRRVTSLASSAATLEEILQFSVQELARLLHSDAAAVFLVNQERSEFKLHRASRFGVLPELPERLSQLALDDPQFSFTVTGSLRILSIDQTSLVERAIIPFYQSILDLWKIETLITVPLVIRDEGIGELWFANLDNTPFEQGDVQVVATAAGQLASVVEQSFLRSQTDESLRRRVDQMVAITRISRELSTSLDLDNLLNLVYDEALRTTHADCGTILLFHLEKDPAQSPSISLFVGDAPENPLSQLNRRVIDGGSPSNIVDFARSEYPPPHRGIQSALIVPIVHQHRPAGLICLHGKWAGQFDDTALEITQLLAVQASVALNNALAYDEQTRRGAMLKRELETLSRLIQVSRSIRPSQSLEQSLVEIARAIQEVTAFQVVVVSVFDPGDSTLKRVAGTGISLELWEELRSHRQPWSALQQLLLPQYKIGDAFLIPEEQLPAVLEDVHLVSVIPEPAAVTEHTWRQRDLLLLPMEDRNQNPLGLISVDAPIDNQRPDQVTFKALEGFAAQASIIIESQLHAGFLESQIAVLERDQSRFESAAEQARSNLPLMLHKELEQAVMLRRLHQRVGLFQSILDLGGLANRQADEAGILRTLAVEMITRFSMQYALIAENTPAGIRLLETVGGAPSSANPEALFGQRNPLRQILQEKTRTPEEGVLFISDLASSPDWKNCPMLSVFDACSLIGMQLDLGGGRIGGILLIGQGVLPAFLEEDRHVFVHLAHQASVGIQNLRLLNETRRRLHDVDLLLNFSRQMGSLQPADIFQSLIENVIRVLAHVDAGWVGVWREQEGAVVLQAAAGYVSNQDMLEIRFARQPRTGSFQDYQVSLPLHILQTGQSVHLSEVNFPQQYQLSSGNLLRYRRATNGRLPVSVMAVPLQRGKSTLGILLLESFTVPDAFTEEDEALASSFSRQAAMAFENARLYQASEQRASQLQALTMVAGTITSSLEQEDLISSLLDQLRLVVPYDTATLWLRSGESLVVAAANGFVDNDLRLNLAVSIQDSILFNTMVQTCAPVCAGDLRTDQRFPNLIDPEYLSWLGIPLIVKSEVIGLIALEKREAEFYDEDIIRFGTTFASQAAVSLENARLYAESNRRARELDERSRRLALLNQFSGELVSSLDVDYIVKLTAEQLFAALVPDGIAAVLPGTRQDYTISFELPGSTRDAPVILDASSFFDRLVETQGIFQTDDIAGEPGLQPLWDAFFQACCARSLLVIPLVSRSVVQGWFLVFRAQQYRYTLPEIELGRTMCNQSAIAIQNARLFAETRQLTADLERRVEDRTKELRSEHKNSQTLLHIITELSASLDMEQVLLRTLKVLNGSLGSEQSAVMLLRSGSNCYQSGIQLACLAGGVGPAFSIERQVAKWVSQNQQPVLIDRIQDDDRWEIDSPAAVGYQSVLAVPLVMGADVLGSLLLFHRVSGFFLGDQIPLVEAAARQIAIALNNAELFNLIRDQSEHLGNLLRDQQIEASRSRAILESVADGVLVTDAANRVNLLNAPAERILNLESGQAVGRSLDQLSDSIGGAASEWMRVILQWSQDLLVTSNFETYAQQMDLGNGRIISVHLAPVFWRQEFLGTVSIFRDISHEVEVDRLKSDFVANVSHELRTPMTSIKGYVDIMLMGASGQITAQQEHFLKIVKSNTERLNLLVDDLLDISRIESGHASFKPQQVDLREIAADVIAELRRSSKDANRSMAFHLESETSLPYAWGDYERVRQIISALVTNGYSYTPDHGWVKVVIHRVDDDLQVDVSDNGIGIGDEERGRIFERFYRGDDPLVLSSAGAGLGLAIAKTLVSMHDGKIWFESSGIYGQGSTFSFTLPVYESQELVEIQNGK